MESDLHPLLEQLDPSLFHDHTELTEKHWQILEAALKVFSEKGFNASRTRDIAQAAGVSEGTIFNYFKSKDALLQGLLIPMVIRFVRPLILANVEKILEKRSHSSIEEVLVELGKDRIQLLKKNWPLVKTIATESQFHPELLEPIREHVIPKILERGKQFFQEEIDNGTIRQVHVFTALRMLICIFGGYVFMRTAFPDLLEWEDDETEIRRMVDLYLHGILHPGPASQPTQDEIS
jgi:AcrR family transcriptional regulator